MASAIKKVVTETDSSMVVELLSSLNSLHHPHQCLIDGIKAIGDSDANISWKKIDRQLYHVGGILAKQCCYLTFSLYYL